MKIFYPYQEKVFDWAKTQDNLALFLEMRLGKTLVVIRWCKYKIATKKLGKERGGPRVLIICPKTIIPNWCNELEDDGIKPIVLNTQRIRQVNGFLGMIPGYFIINYEGVTGTNIAEMEWDIVILDESSKMKDPKTKITKILLGEDPEQAEKLKKGLTKDDLIKPILHKATCKAILTGSPAPENAIDYFNQLKFLFGSVLTLDNYYRFRNKFFYPSPYKQGKFILSRGMAEAFRDYVSKIAYVLKRDQLNIGSKKIYQPRYIEWDDPKIEKEYKQYELTWFTQNFETNWIIVALNHMRQMTGGFPAHAPNFRSDHKVKEVLNLLSNELENESVVIWCYHVNEIDELKRILKSKGYDVTDIQGDVPMFERQKRIDDFNAGKYQIIILQYKVGGLGINLSKADTVINYSKSYSATEVVQAEDRVIHPEKQRPILYIDLLTKGTIDEDIYAIVKNKIQDSNTFLDDVYKRVQARLAGENK